MEIALIQGEHAIRILGILDKYTTNKLLNR